jgi:hypothetical protein
MFLSNSESILRICSLLNKHRIPFLAGITDSDFGNPDNKALLSTIVQSGGALAIHGIRHTGTFGPYTSEILQLDDNAIVMLAESVITKYPEETLRPIAFIPPFNAIDWHQVLLLGRYFPIICGGPESVRFTGGISGPAVLKNSGIFFPSLYPYYQKADGMLRSHIAVSVSQLKVPVCFTIHCHDEYMDNFQSLSILIEKIKPYWTSWHEFASGKNY